jgi:hypothetical protein
MDNTPVHVTDTQREKFIALVENDKTIGNVATRRSRYWPNLPRVSAPQTAFLVPRPARGVLRRRRRRRQVRRAARRRRCSTSTFPATPP